MAQRLVNLFVKNVAAVERPANKRQFLVVKSAVEKAEAKVGDTAEKSELTFNDAMFGHRMMKVYMALSERYGALMETMNAIRDSEGDKSTACKSALQDFVSSVQSAIPEMMTFLTDVADDESEIVEKQGRKISADRMDKLKAMRDMLDRLISEGDIEMEKKADVSLFKKLAAMMGRAAGADDTVIAELEKDAGGDVDPIPDNVQFELTKAAGETAALRKANDDLKSRLEKAEATTKAASEEAFKLRDEAELRKFAEEVSGFKDVGLDPSKDAALLKSVEEKVGKPEADRLREIFRAQLAQKNASGLLKEVGVSGSGGPVPNSAVAEVEQKVAEIVSKNDKLDRTAAMHQVFAENHGLYDRYRKETLVRG